MTSTLKEFFLSDRLNRAIILVFIAIFSINILFLGLDYLDLIEDNFFLYGWFNVNLEYNPPAIFNGLLFLIAPVRLFQLLSAKEWRLVDKWGWLIIGVVFIFLGLDEVFQIHENQPKSWNLETSNWFKYYLIGLGFISLPCIPLFLGLPNVIKILLIVSGVVFISGAVGIESISIYFSSNQMWKSYIISTVVEEFMEMLGLIIFSCSLVKLKKMEDC